MQHAAGLAWHEESVRVVNDDGEDVEILFEEGDVSPPTDTFPTGTDVAVAPIEAKKQRYWRFAGLYVGREGWMAIPPWIACIS